MYTITLQTNSNKLAFIFENEVSRMNAWITSYSTKKDFMEHLFTLSLYILNGTECTIKWDTITTWNIEHKKKINNTYIINK